MERGHSWFEITTAPLQTKMMSHRFANDTFLATLLLLSPSLVSYETFLHDLSTLLFFFSCYFLFISHLSLPEDMKSCVLKFLDIATSDKNAWQRRSFPIPSFEEGFLFFVYIVGYQSMVMTGFVRRACVYLLAEGI